MRKLIVFLVVAGMVIVNSGIASATSLLLDRGLPTSNLNNAAGASRSNVAWAFGSDSYGSWLAGDDFKIGGTGNYFVDKIRIWSTSNTGLSVWFGEAGGTISQLSSVPLVSATTYSDNSSYQGSSGSYLPLYQLDISLNMVLSGSATYQFFLNGLQYAFLHSSNAALSGSSQQGSDNQMLYALVAPGSDIATDIGSWDSDGYGWDKSSDANIQVFGTPVPEPGTVLLLGLGLVGIAGIRRRFKK